MTLDGYFALYPVLAPVCLASDRATFGNNCVKTNKDRHILSAALIFDRDSGFLQYKVYSRGFSRNEASKDNGVSEYDIGTHTSIKLTIKHHFYRSL